MRNWRTLFVVLILGGCAHQWEPARPGLTAADFEETKARCSIAARNSGDSFEAYGSPRYVAAATAGAAIGEAIKAQQNFNDCMVANGWRIATPQSTAARQAAQQATVASLKAVASQRAACITAVRDKPEYAVLKPHLSDITTGQYSMTQETDETVPTVAEGHLLASYIDEFDPCVTASIAGMTQIAPRVGPILEQFRADEKAIVINLVERKITWGELAREQTAAQATAQAKLQGAK